MRVTFFILMLLTSLATFAQKGTVSGTLTDKDLQNEPLPFASVSLKGTTIGVSTDNDGKYSLSAKPGDYVLVLSFVGYQTVEVPITLKADETITVDRALGSGSVTLQDVQVQTAVNRQKESALLLEQKNAVEIKQNIGAQELSRKGVTDVATAVTKTTGITKQEGSGNIYVRGLGDRYNSTTLNGLPIPSNDPEKKNITLEIFPTEIVEYVSIDKVYNNRIYGDFAGGNVDIVSKEHRGDAYVRVDAGSSINSNAVSNSDFRLSGRPNSFGFSTINQPANPLGAYNYNTLVLEEKNPVAGSFGISGGKTYSVGKEGKLSVFATGAFGNDYLSLEDGRSWADINGAGFASKRFDDYRSYTYATNTTGMANVAYKISADHKLNFNSLFINSSNLETEEYRGYSVDWAEDGKGFVRRSTYSKTALWINQLLGSHRITDRIKGNWAVGYNIVHDVQPDRMTNKMKIQDNGLVTINSISAPDNNRYFQDLDEKELTALASLDYKFAGDGSGEYAGKVTVGYSGRFKNRRLEATQFNFDTNAAFLSQQVDPNNLDQFYNAANLAAGWFQISTFRGDVSAPNPLVPQYYEGDMTIHAGFASAEYKVNEKLTGVIGIRAEQITQDVEWATILSDGDNKLEKTAILPSLTLKYALNDKQNLRFAASKTYTLPQFKERAPFAYEEITQVKIGNKDLYASDDYNVDLKWEFFPKADEVFSVTAFGKLIQNPINDVIIASSTNDMSWLNTGDVGTAVGAEIEARKILWGGFEGSNAKLTGGLNLSYLHTEQDLDAAKVRKETTFEAEFTNKKSAFTGASDFLANADISFLKEWNEKQGNFMATLAFNYFSDRIYSLGINQRGNLVDKAVGTLDLILKSKLNRHFGVGLSARNLLDPTIERVQENRSGDVLAQTYKKGVNVGFSVNYTF